MHATGADLQTPDPVSLEPETLRLHGKQEPFLRRLLQLHGAAVEIRRRDFLEGTWAPFLLHAASLEVSYEWGTPQS